MGTQKPEYWLDPETGEEIEIVNAQGQEVLDPTPMAPPVGYQRTESMFDIVQRMTREALLQQELEKQGFETFEEADDFEVGDDYEPPSEHENDLDPDYRQIAEDVKISRKLQEAQAQAAATETVRQDPKPSAAAPPPEGAKPETPPKP